MGTREGIRGFLCFGYNLRVPALWVSMGQCMFSHRKSGGNNPEGSTGKWDKRLQANNYGKHKVMGAGKEER